MNPRLEPLVEAVADRVVERLRGLPTGDERLRQLRDAGLSCAAIATVVSLEGHDLTQYQVRYRLGESHEPRSTDGIVVRRGRQW